MTPAVRTLLGKLKAFEAAHPTRPGPQCSVCKMPAELRAFIVEGRKAGSTFRALAAVATAEGHRVSPFMVGYHLREHGEAR